MPKSTSTSARSPPQAAKRPKAAKRAKPQARQAPPRPKPAPSPKPQARAICSKIPQHILYTNILYKTPSGAQVAPGRVGGVCGSSALEVNLQTPPNWNPLGSKEHGRTGQHQPPRDPLGGEPLEGNINPKPGTRWVARNTVGRNWATSTPTGPAGRRATGGRKANKKTTTR
jgi:hypothetical protein